MDVEHVDKKARIEELDGEAQKQITIDLGEALKKKQESDLDLLRIIAILVQRVEKLESVLKSF